jgi:predicted permease
MSARRSSERPPAPRALRWVLLLYPRDHRERYAQEMEGCFLREREAAGGGVRFWARAVLDHLQAAAAVRRRQRRQREGIVSTLWEDLRHATRTLRRAPAFTAFATITLALGIGATTAAFSVLDRVVLRPLPYPGAERMVVVGRTSIQADRIGDASPPLVLALQRAPGPAEATVGAMEGTTIFEGRGDPERLSITRVSEGFFPFFGARPAAGRLLVDADQEPGATEVVVLGHAFWESRFGGDPSVVGTTVDLNGVAHTVVGVTSDDFVPPERLSGGASIWVPLGLPARDAQSGVFTVWTVARLRPGTSVIDLEAHWGEIIREMYSAAPTFAGTPVLQDLRAATVGDVGSALARILAALALLLLISCANVANLLFARGPMRLREMVVRSALGARRSRLVRQLVTESVLLGMMGGALGAFLAFVSVGAFRRFSPGGLPRLSEIAVDGRGLAFSVGLGLGTVLLFGILPAIRAAGAPGTGRDRSIMGSRSVTPNTRMHGTLILAETALTVVLVVATGLMTRDLVHLAREDPGFRSGQLVDLRLSLTGRYGTSEERSAFWRQLQEEIGELPGVSSLGLSTQVPYATGGVLTVFTPEGHEGVDAGVVFPVISVTEDFFPTMGIGVSEGRTFSDAELRGEARGALVNETFANVYWPGDSALGKRIFWGAGSEEDAPHEVVVGVMPDVRSQPGVTPSPQIYVPLELGTYPSLDLLVRTQSEAAGLIPGLREVIRRIDPGLPITRVETMDSLVSRALTRPRFYTALFASVGLVALVLAMVGVYGTTAYATRSRTREIGIRMALGARSTRVVWEVVARTLLAVAGGTAAGLGIAFVGSRALADVLLTIGPRDAITYILVSGVVLLAGAAAALVPAMQASRVDPASTLREDG